MDQNAQAQVLNALLRQRELLDKQIQKIVNGMIRSTPPQESAPTKTTGKRSAISPAAKKRMAEATRKRWAQYREAKAAAAKKAAEGPQKPAKKTATKKFRADTR